jgi:hypothetical protein
MECTALPRDKAFSIVPQNPARETLERISAYRQEHVLDVRTLVACISQNGRFVVDDIECDQVGWSEAPFIEAVWQPGAQGTSPSRRC